MELLFVTVIAAGIGLVLRYLLPSRGSYGLLLLPAVSAAAAAIVWVALLWIGLTFDGGWIWVAALGAAFLTALATGLVLPRTRANHDERRLAELSGAKTA